MVNGSRYYTALENVSIASALSTALIIYPRQIRVHQNADSLKLQLLTGRKKEWWPATADSLPQAHYVSTILFPNPQNLPIASPTRYQ